ncbi:GxxExxY protein [Lutispora sp.]|jgi:GxxExxY protein|uniref:GxxExxY protein n=1 Tax=Lutispora sp. TaxID=2828727 RepID=UPI003562C860
MYIYEEISKIIVNSAYEVHRILGSGYLEKVYENALVKELESRNIKCEQQVPLEVYYKEDIVGNYIADIIVNKEIILEIKAIEALDKKHFAQLLNYLKATRKKLGFIINFGTSKIQIKRIVN